VTTFEYRVSALVLRVLGWLCNFLPIHHDRVTLATARKAVLDGNLLYVHGALTRLRPSLDVRLALEPYSYGLAGKVRYALRLVRGMYLLRTSALVVVDNAWLPIHVAPHRAGTQVVQVWHAAGALKRFGLDAVQPLAEPERSFLHRHYDWVVTSGEAARGPWARAFGMPEERVLALGSPRTDFFHDAEALAAARTRIFATHPALEGRRVITYAPTFRGRGRDKHPGEGLDAARLRASLAPSDVLVLKSHPNLDPRLVDLTGFDVIADPAEDLNDLLAATDILITDYSSAMFEFALLRRPIVLLVGDLEAYERDPGMYLDYRTDMIGTQVVDTDGVIDAIANDRFDIDPYEAFVVRELGPLDGRASERLVDRFLPA
jgi:CDP-glycerol glycerophosphotransferase (TagB/SpsB family)